MEAHSGRGANIFQDDFERGMVALHAAQPHAVPVCQRSMAGYFFRFEPTLSSLYVRLGRLIVETGWRGCIASLNYERLLLQGFGMFQGAPGQLEICFPHGCCNLFCMSAWAKASGVTFAGMNTVVNGPVELVHNPREFWSRLRENAFPPVMSYFEPAKRTTSGANFIEHQRDRFQDIVRNASAISIVGVHVREVDRHIWEPLADASAPIYYCSGPQGVEDFRKWQRKYRPSKVRNDILSSGYWSTDFDAINGFLDIHTEQRNRLQGRHYLQKAKAVR